MTADGWHWIGGGTTSKLPIDPSHEAAVNRLLINNAVGSGPACVQITKNTLVLEDVKCDENYCQICTIVAGGAGIGASIGKTFT